MYHDIRPRRLFVSGGSRLSDEAALLWCELGSLLAQEDGLVVITGGLAGFKDDDDALTSDSKIVEGMLPVLAGRGAAVAEHIETVLPGSDYDWENAKRFEIGAVHRLDKRSSQPRRFHMVNSADVVISLEGKDGTQGVLDMATALQRPMLPLPFGGHASAEVWEEQRGDIVKAFQFDHAEAEYFDSLELQNLSDPDIKELAVRVHKRLMKGFTQGCFVIMQFHEDRNHVFNDAIEPAITRQGFHAWRTDRVVKVGDIIRAVRDGISHCQFVIADTTGDRPNIMYEIGFAHALDKPVILLRSNLPDGTSPDAPFDFRTHTIFYYDDNPAGLDELRNRLGDAIATVSGKRTHN